MHKLIDRNASLAYKIIMSINIKPRISGVLCSIIIYGIYSKRSNAQPIAAPPTAYEKALSGTSIII